MILMLIGTLALTGFHFYQASIPKDAIIEFAYSKQSSIGNYAAVVGIFTAFNQFTPETIFLNFR